MKFQKLVIVLAIWMALLSVLLAGTSAQAFELSADSLFQPDRMLDIAIELPADQWDQLRQQSRDIGAAFSGSTDSPFTYFKANITIGDVRIESVGLRKKGFIGSLDDQFPSLKVKFDEYIKQRPIEGIDTLTLNNNKQDPSLVSQYMTYRLFNAAGVHAPRVSFAKVTVNGKYLGIYSNVESVGKPFLKRRFDSSSGNLYEGTLADFYPSAVDRLEAKTNEKDNDRSKVLQLAKLLSSNEELSVGKIEELVDIDNFIRFWALESLLKFWDGYTNNQNNFWVYEKPANGKVYFIPWGADGALMDPKGLFGFGAPSGPTSVYAESMLANRLYHDGPTAERYRTTMRDILANVWKEDDLVKEVDDVESLVTDHLHRRQAGTSRSMNDVRSFIRARRKAVEKELESWPVRVSAQPRKPSYTVEVGVANGSFDTVWSGQPAAEAAKVGAAELRLMLESKDVALTKVDAISQLVQVPRAFFGFGPPGPPGGGGPFGMGEPPATIVLHAVRESDGKPLTLALSIDTNIFVESRNKTIEVKGTLNDGENGFFNPFGGRQVRGTLTLEDVGMNADDKVKGSFDLKVFETHGGMMDRRGWGGRNGPGGPPERPK